MLSGRFRSGQRPGQRSGLRPGQRSGLWRHHDFVRLWTGETVSVFGSLIGQMAMLFTAVIWLHSSPLAVSVLSACGIVPA